MVATQGTIPECSHQDGVDLEPWREPDIVSDERDFSEVLTRHPPWTRTTIICRVCDRWEGLPVTWRLEGHLRLEQPGSEWWRSDKQ